MDPARKRTVRLVVALTAALLLAGALAWTSFSASSEARTPAQLSDAKVGQTYEVTGRVAKGSYKRSGSVHTFLVRETKGTATVPVRYEGAVPDPFREGRDVIVTARKGADGTFVSSAMLVKCPSKFTKDQQS
jgi:cytochrome c-type biogenesis protein CcmE